MLKAQILAMTILNFLMVSWEDKRKRERNKFKGGI